MKKNKTVISTDNFEFERRLWAEGYQRIMGLDEVGRGCLAGPVVAAGVIFDPGVEIEGVTDSKAIKSHCQRSELATEIKAKARFWTIKSCSPEEIDQVNILKASLLAMQKCTDVATPPPDYLLIDGKIPPPVLTPNLCIVKGDLRSVSIGAASILAKVYRDELMFELHKRFPWYGWDTNVGYPTQRHYSGLAEKGITPHHRKSFRLGTESVLSLPIDGTMLRLPRVNTEIPFVEVKIQANSDHY